ncbi:hypothetical protein G4G27_01080 [Sphingomonas sp. So64.6b]|uniref:hypothetical protein n=1 Tax=Sphingomonas sp. So64.6b TaxID=2997354 RepID=UPI0015FFE896|nr:hypothetical protein [Sphingomonas sp. So64.6b]QNA82757.1 hypothetical protein G4G27_01080 [Sphingomonas sp. So64.6b]
MIAATGLLDTNGCRSVVERVVGNRDNWIDRSPRGDATFFTLGRASYLDACPPDADPQSTYYGKIDAANGELIAMFGDLYASLLDRLAAELQGEVVLADRLAIPGFHIFLGRGILGAGKSGRHFDIQYERLRFPPGPVEDDPISFTLALELPTEGSGLDLWDVTVEDFDRAFKAGRVATLDDMARRRILAYHPYSVGQLLIHRGLWLHRISSPGTIHGDDRRITLQGHGLRIAGRWILYW